MWNATAHACIGSIIGVIVGRFLPFLEYSATWLPINLGIERLTWVAIAAQKVFKPNDHRPSRSRLKEDAHES
jgi:hypothetical protein